MLYVRNTVAKRKFRPVGFREWCDEFHQRSDRHTRTTALTNLYVLESGWGLGGLVLDVK